MQSYKSYYMVSPQTVFTYPFHHAKLQILLHGVTAIVFTYPVHHAKLQILLHGVTANSLYLSFSPCKATNLTTWCHRKQSLLILFTVQSYKSYYMCHRNSLYLSFSPCKATNLTTWCHRKQSLLILFTMQSYKSYYMVSPQTVFTYPFHHAKLQILLHGVTANSLYLSFSPCKATNLTTWCHRNSLYLSSSPCKATNLTTWCHRKQSLLILFTMQSYKSYYMVSPQTVFTYPFHHAKLQILLHGVTAIVFTYPVHHAKLQILLHGVTANSLYLSFSPCKATNLTTWCHRKQSLLILFTM